VIPAKTYSYRHAESIISSEYPAERKDILDILAAVDWKPKMPFVVRERGAQTFNLSIDQAKTNAAFEEQFKLKDWQIHPRIVSHSDSKLVADFKKGKVQVEIQFGNMARWYTDVFKFLLSYSADDIEVGVLIVPLQATAAKIDENVVYFERVLRELPHAKMAVTIPIWVIGVE
jgi:restriction endonuclease BglII